MIKQILKYLFLLTVGGSIYVCIELLARGFSHWTMFLVGGLCFVIVGLINEITPAMPFVHQMLLSAACITLIEFVSGCVLNLYFGLNIWDYSDEFANILGQICLKHTIYWFLLSAVAILLDDRIRHKLFGEEIPHYKLFTK